MVVIWFEITVAVMFFLNTTMNLLGITLAGFVSRIFKCRLCPSAGAPKTTGTTRTNIPMSFVRKDTMVSAIFWSKMEAECFRSQTNSRLCWCFEGKQTD